MKCPDCQNVVAADASECPSCGSILPDVAHHTPIVTMPRKSQAIQLLLTLILGPIGLFYSSIGGAFGLIAAAIVLGLVTAGIGGLLMWPVSILVGIATVSNHNRAADVIDAQTRAAIR